MSVYILYMYKNIFTYITKNIIPGLFFTVTCGVACFIPLGKMHISIYISCLGHYKHLSLT